MARRKSRQYGLLVGFPLPSISPSPLAFCRFWPLIGQNEMQGILGNSVALCGRCHFLPALRPSGGQIFKADGHFMSIFITSSCPAVFLWQYFVAWIFCLYSFDCHYFSPPSLPKSVYAGVNALPDLPWSSTEIPRAMCGPSSPCGPHQVHILTTGTLW